VSASRNIDLNQQGHTSFQVSSTHQKDVITTALRLTAARHRHRNFFSKRLEPVTRKSRALHNGNAQLFRQQACIQARLLKKFNFHQESIMAVTNVAELNALVERVKKAQREYANFTQEQVDTIFRAAALAAADARIPLAKMAVAESGMGIVEDKVIKNHFASEYIYNAYKDEKTCGILDTDDTFGTITIAEPTGLICGIVPTTNPTSTAIFKALISLKTRNGIIFSPHPRAKDATNKAADIVLQAAIAAGAPKDIIGWIDQPSVELSNQLMHHPDINLILATGGPGMVKAAYSSGKPAIGVGAGNTPVVIDETADIKRAVASILMSKTFDNGVICASEQSVIVVDSVYDAVRERFASHGGYLLQGAELKAVQDIILKNGCTARKTSNRR